jgi:Cytochrome c554 and c-prime
LRSLLLLGLVACSGGRVPERPHTEAPTFAPRPGGLVPLEPGTRDPKLLSAGACRTCHQAEHALWSKSRHAAAWTNGTFQREYKDVPRDWCIHCHAPLVPQTAEAKRGGGPLASEGVGCATCHVREGRLVSRRKKPGSPHDTLASARFGSADFCAGCHEFGFPVIDRQGVVTALTEHPMQATVSQFRAGPFAGAPDGCHTCHLPHAYPGAHDLGMLRGALSFQVCRDGDDAVLSLENVGAGHNVPTGDVHRHINVRAWRSTAPERLFEAFVGRRFELLESGGKKTVWDSTIAPRHKKEWRVALAALGGEPEEPVSFEVRYVYTAEENPPRHRHPGEPTSRVIAEQRTAELAPCTR